MGGESVFRISADDANLNVIIEVMTERGRRLTMAQRYLPEIKDGDKRILLVDGEPVPYALARIPAAGETRANLAAGGRGVGRPLTERDRICAQVGPELRRRGLLFVGLDVIGDYRDQRHQPDLHPRTDAQFGLNISARLMDCIEASAVIARTRRAVTWPRCCSYRSLSLLGACASAEASRRLTAPVVHPGNGGRSQPVGCGRDARGGSRESGRNGAERYHTRWHAWRRAS